MTQLSASVTTTSKGRRWVICPSCIAVNAPVPVGAIGCMCRHCDVEFDLKESKKPEKLTRKR
jgi:hypothetical protein